MEAARALEPAPSPVVPLPVRVNAVVILLLMGSYSRTLHSKPQPGMSDGRNSVAPTKLSCQRAIFPS